MRNGGNWIGIAVFLILIFGNQFIGPLTGFISSVTGVTIPAGLVYVALILLLTVVPGIFSALGRFSRQGDERLPTGSAKESPRMSGDTASRMPSDSMPRMPSGSMQQELNLPPPAGDLPDWIRSTPRLDQYQSQVKRPEFKPPRYDPIISPTLALFFVVVVPIFLVIGFVIFNLF